MEVRSAPKQGCEVLLEVPVPRRSVSMPNSPATGDEMLEPTSTDDPAHLAVKADDLHIGRKVHLAGFKETDGLGTAALVKLGECLKRQYIKLGCEMVDIQQAELIVADGTVELAFNPDLLNESQTKDIVFLVKDDHEADERMLSLEKRKNKKVRRFKKPGRHRGWRQLPRSHRCSRTNDSAQA